MMGMVMPKLLFELVLKTQHEVILVSSNRTAPAAWWRDAGREEISDDLQSVGHLPV